jgi:hypothetical protein
MSRSSVHDDFIPYKLPYKLHLADLKADLESLSVDPKSVNMQVLANSLQGVVFAREASASRNKKEHRRIYVYLFLQILSDERAYQCEGKPVQIQQYIFPQIYNAWVM